MFMALCSSLILLVSEKEIRLFLLSRVRGQPVPCRFCGVPDGDGHLALAWRASRVHGASPCAADASESACYMVKVALGRHSSGLQAEWSPSDEYDEAVAASSMPDHPNVWAGGRLVLDRIAGVSSSGAVFFLLAILRSAGVDVGGVMLTKFALRVRCILAEVSAQFLGLCSLFRELRCGVPFWLYSLLLPFIWGLTTWVWLVMLGVCLMVNMVLFQFELVKDGDLLLLTGGMRGLRGLDTVRITKVKGHADEGVVLDGRVRELDRLGNDAADEAAAFGRRRFIDARCNLSGGRGRWYPVHRFFIAISRAVVNHDGRGWYRSRSHGLVCWCPPQEASAGSCGSGPGMFHRATWYLGFSMGYCACFSLLC